MRGMCVYIFTFAFAYASSLCDLSIAQFIPPNDYDLCFIFLSFSLCLSPIFGIPIAFHLGQSAFVYLIYLHNNWNWKCGTPLNERRKMNAGKRTEHDESANNQIDFHSGTAAKARKVPVVSQCSHKMWTERCRIFAFDECDCACECECTDFLLIERERVYMSSSVW